MKIAGFHPVSFNNYPGMLAAVVFTQGCNFRCPYCHNRALIPSDRGGQYDEQEILARLAARKGKISGVVISGGEPTLQPNLADFCRKVRALGFLLKLDTNGGRPEVLADLIAAGLVDYIAMDIKAPWPLYHRLAGVQVEAGIICRSIELIAGSGLPHHFRTTVVDSLLSKDDLSAIEKLVPQASRHIFQAYREPPPATSSLA